MNHPPPPDRPRDQGGHGDEESGPPPGGATPRGYGAGGPRPSPEPAASEEHPPEERERGPGRLAEWWQRLVARIIDTVIVGIPYVIVLAVVLFAFANTAAGEYGTETYGAQPTGDLGLGARVLGAVIGFLIAIAYEALMLAAYGRTVGKMVMRLQVMPIIGPAPRLPASTALLRALTWYLPAFLNWIPVIGWLIGLIPILNGLWPLWDKPNRQSFNDKLAGTVVVTTA
ncbi:RDD family protein [Marinactinospora rubrisoli]|uniref:RDD family protein n=1 Tax=Marinactinospora rubrisoli TaxID=2715399 RepID=A0ABW2KN19_9ACTN